MELFLLQRLLRFLALLCALNGEAKRVCKLFFLKKKEKGRKKEGETHSKTIFLNGTKIFFCFFFLEKRLIFSSFSTQYFISSYSITAANSLPFSFISKKWEKKGGGTSKHSLPERPWTKKSLQFRLLPILEIFGLKKKVPPPLPPTCAGKENVFEHIWNPLLGSEVNCTLYFSFWRSSRLGSKPQLHFFFVCVCLSRANKRGGRREGKKAPPPPPLQDPPVQTQAEPATDH